MLVFFRHKAYTSPTGFFFGHSTPTTVSIPWSKYCCHRRCVSKLLLWRIKEKCHISLSSLNMMLLINCQQKHHNTLNREAHHHERVTIDISGDLVSVLKLPLSCCLPQASATPTMFTTSCSAWSYMATPHPCLTIGERYARLTQPPLSSDSLCWLADIHIRPAVAPGLHSMWATLGLLLVERSPTIFPMGWHFISDF